MGVEVLQGQSAELLIDLASQAVDGSLRHTGHGVPGHPREEGGDEIQRRQAEQDHSKGTEIGAHAGDCAGPGDQVRERAVSLVQDCNGLGMRRSGRHVLAELLADQAVHQLVDAVAQDLRAEDLACGAQERDGHDE